MQSKISLVFFLVIGALTGVAHAADPMPPERKVLAARNLIHSWMQQHDKEHARVVRAYAKKDRATLEKIATKLLRDQGFPQKGNVDLMLDEYSAYLSCDTAYTDLGLLAGAMSKHLSNGNLSTERGLNQEQSDYALSTGVCKRRLAMTPAKAWADYQSE
jgi:hypothetical protein